MKATGIVRRIDDLGRVVIPKEIRRTMRIREGDPLEIYTSNDGEVIFKKYSPIGEMSEHAAQVADIMHRLAGCPVAIFDRDHVVSVSGAAKKEWNARRVSPELEDLMEQRKMYYAENGASGMIPAEGVEKHAVACLPIIWKTIGILILQEQTNPPKRSGCCTTRPLGGFYWVKNKNGRE